MKYICISCMLTVCVLLAHLGAAQTPVTTTVSADAKNASVTPGTVSGSGTTNYIPRWTSSTALGNSKVYQTGGNVGVGTTSPALALDVVGRVNTSLDYLVGGVTQLAMPGGAASGNIAAGGGLRNTTTGVDNTAIDGCTFPALWSNNSGSYNTAGGLEALYSNTIGSFNTAIGDFVDNFTGGAGGFNTFVGSGAAQDSSANHNANTGVGFFAAGVITTGTQNTGFGEFTINTTSGSNNIGIGYNGGGGLTGGDSNNIDIGNGGISGDDGVIRIGTSGTQTSLYAAGIYGVSSGSSSAIPVLVDSSGQLVTVSSSRRFKMDIQDMGNASRNLMRLRPVTFRYRKPFADGSQPLQFGLIAEEVSEVYPGLVAYSADGQIETVKYQTLAPMLLNEVQHDEADIHDLQEQFNQMEAALASVSHALKSQ